MPRRRPEPVLASDGPLAVERDPNRPSGRLLLQEGMQASYVDLADQRHLEFDYLRWMRLVLRSAGARRVLHVGGGGCALARALALEDPGGRQQVCELDARVLALAREHLGLRRAPGLRVRRAEGRRFIAAQDDGSWEAIVLDAFLGAEVPRHLITVEAMRDCARVAPLTLVNVLDSRVGRDVALIGSALAAAYPSVWKLSGRSTNVVLVGARRALKLAQVAVGAAADPSPARVGPPDLLRRSLAGVAPLTDAELHRDQGGQGPAASRW